MPAYFLTAAPNDGALLGVFRLATTRRLRDTALVEDGEIVGMTIRFPQSQSASSESSRRIANNHRTQHNVTRLGRRPPGQQLIAETFYGRKVSAARFHHAGYPTRPLAKRRAFVCGLTLGNKAALARNRLRSTGRERRHVLKFPQSPPTSSEPWRLRDELRPRAQLRGHGSTASLVSINGYLIGNSSIWRDCTLWIFLRAERTKSVGFLSESAAGDCSPSL